MSEAPLVRLRHDVCARSHAAQFSKITFVHARKPQWVRGVHEHVFERTRPVWHGDDRPVSICTQFLWWRFGRDAVLDSHLVDVWQRGTELFLFPSDAVAVDIKFPTFAEWAREQRDVLGLGESYITDEEYAQTLRKQLPPKLNPERYPAFIASRAALLAREGYDPVELYKEYLRNLIRRDRITFPTFDEWAQSQRDPPLSLPEWVITQENYAETLREHVREKLGLAVWKYERFLDQHGASMARARFDPVKMYKNYLRGEILNNLERQPDVKEEEPEETMAILLRPDEMALDLFPRTAFRTFHITLNRADTMATLMNKVAQVTGIPIESIKLIYDTVELTRLHELATSLRGNMPFFIVDTRHRGPAPDTMAGLLHADEDSVDLHPRTLSKRFHINLNRVDTFATLLQKVHEATGIPIDSMRLVYGADTVLKNLRDLAASLRSNTPFVAINTRPKG